MRYNALHCTSLHFDALHRNAPNCATALRCATRIALTAMAALRCTVLNFIELLLGTLHCTALHCLRYTRNTDLQCAAMRCTA
jgi:hypothetical protein